MGDFKKTGDIKLFPVLEKEVFDIDYEWQFELAEALWKNNKIWGYIDGIKI